MSKTNLRRLAGIVVFVLLVAFLVIGALSITAAEKPVVASVNLDRIAQAHPAFAEVVQIYQNEIAQLQKEMEEKMEGLDEEEAIQLQMEIEEQLQQRAIELQNEAIDSIQNDIQRIASEKGYDYIVAEDMLLAGGPVKDVTDEFLAEIESQPE